MNENATQLALTLEPDTERRQDLPPADRELIERAIRCLEERYRVTLDVLTSPGATRDYVKLRLDGLGYEVFAMILLDNRHGVMRYVELFRGTLDGASVHPREVVRLVMAHNAAAVILAHNHPSGVTEPSQADIRITLTLRASGMAIGGPAPLAPTAPPGQTVAAGQGQRRQPSLNPT